MEVPTNIVSKLTGKSDLEAKIKELEQKIEVKDIERDGWVSAVEGYVHVHVHVHVTSLLFLANIQLHVPC